MIPRVLIAIPEVSASLLWSTLVACLPQSGMLVQLPQHEPFRRKKDELNLYFISCGWEAKIRMWVYRFCFDFFFYV